MVVDVVLVYLEYDLVYDNYYDVGYIEVNEIVIDMFDECESDDYVVVFI